MRTRTTLATVAILAATLTACASSDDNKQGTAERATTAASSPPATPSPDCGPDSALSQADWMTQCGSSSPTPAADQPDIELNVGDTFAYTDGLKVKVTSINTVTRYGAYDDKPDADQTGFRVTWTITNGTPGPYDLGQITYNTEGATTGGSTEFIYVEPDSKQMTGRLAPGRTGTFTAEYAIAKTDGNTILFTMSRMDDAWLKSGSAFAENPHWTGTIQ